MNIYKIMTSAQWDELDQNGHFDGAPIDLSDGYIHFSTKNQAQETAAKHFADQNGLMLVALSADTFGTDLAWEPSRGGDLFPHLYNRPILKADVIWAKPLPIVNGTHQFPEMT